MVQFTSVYANPVRNGSLVYKRLINFVWSPDLIGLNQRPLVCAIFILFVILKIMYESIGVSS